jgi:histidyl-tRNA synthetase
MAGRESARLFYVQNVLRFERGDAQREDWQCGVELIGDTYPRGDVELILLARETLQRLDLAPRFKLSHPGIVRALLDKAGLSLTDQLALYDRVLAGDLAPLDEVEAKLPGSASVRSLLSMEGEGPAYVTNLSNVLEPAVPEVAAPLRELAAVSSMLAGMGVVHEIAPLLVRQFEYYTGPVFQAYVGDQKVAGGGRYDALVALVGGRPLPASGFAIEMDAVSPLLKADQQTSRVITIDCAAVDDLSKAFALAVALREVQTPVRVTSGGGKGEVTVSGGEYHVSLNGGKPMKHSDIAAVVRAVTKP